MADMGDSLKGAAQKSLAAAGDQDQVQSKQKLNLGGDQGQVQSKRKLNLGAIPEGATLLTDLEAEQALIRINAQVYSLSEQADKCTRLPEAFYMALEYAFNAAQCYAPVETVMKIMEPLKKHGLSNNEIGLIVNMLPISVDEVSVFLPFLEPKMSLIREPLRIAVEELAIVSQSVSYPKGPYAGSNDGDRGFHFWEAL